MRASPTPTRRITECMARPALTSALGAQLAVCARAKAVEAIKAVKGEAARHLPHLRAAWQHSLRRAHLPADESGSGLAQHSWKAVSFAA